MVMSSKNVDNSDASFDEFARAAGAALRRPAPHDGLTGVRASRQRRRVVQASVASGAAAIVLITGVLVLRTNQSDSDRLVTTDSTISTSPVPSTSTTTSASTTAPPSTTAPTITTGVELRLDGIGPHAFGTSQRVVEATLTEALGQPEVIEQQPTVYPCIRWGCSDSTVLHWPRAGLLVAFADRSTDGDVLPERAVVAWTLTPTTPWFPDDVHVFDPTSNGSTTPEIRLTLDNGIGLGSTSAELQSAYPSAGDGWWNYSAGVPTRFFVTDPAGDLTGDIDWDVVTDLQSALVSDGASIAVDGIAGPNTIAALSAYQKQTGRDNPTEALEALGITGPAPDDRIVRLSAGEWWSEGSCGDLEPFGFPNEC
jgi:hypothetical protein